MTTIVLVTIGILLAAAAALMTIWYGGGAFDQGRVNADASRLVTEGSQIERAVGLYRAQEGRTPDVSNGDDPLQPLIDRHYLADRPSGGNGRWYVDYASHMIRADLGAADDPQALSICRAARREQKLPNPGQVYRCDGSDYPFAHPPGTLPAIEPCCRWEGATASDAGGGRGSTPGSSGGSAGGSMPGYDGTGSTNQATCEQRVDFLRRSFDAIQTGTKAFYLKYHQISNIYQMVDLGYIPAWARTAVSGDYSPPDVLTTWKQSPWPGGIYADKPYVHVSLNDDLFSCFAKTWSAKYGSRSRPDNYYGNHLSEGIVLPLYPVDVSPYTGALDALTAAIGRYKGDKGFLPRRPAALVDEGYLSSLPGANGKTFASEYSAFARSKSDYTANGNQRAVAMVVGDEETCRRINVELNGGDALPDWAQFDRGCFNNDGTYKVYSYVTGAIDPAIWYPYDEMPTGNPSAHFVYTTSQSGLIRPYSGDTIAMSGYTYWGMFRQNGRLTLHPGPNVADTTTLRFVAPQAGSYHFVGLWQPQGGCGDGVEETIDGFGTRYGSSSVRWPFDFHRTLAKGGTVNFTLGNRGTDKCDGTYLDLVARAD